MYYFEINNLINLIPYIISPPPPFNQWLIIVRGVFIGISLLLTFVIIYLILKTTWLSFSFSENIIELLTYKPLGAGKIIKQWQRIKSRLRIDSEAENKLAIIEADLILNSALEKIGFADKTFEERIKRLTSDLLPNTDQVLEAHKIYNNIVYDPDYKLDSNEAKNIISIYEKALIDLQIL